MKIVQVLCIIFILGSFLPALDQPHWFFRTPDFIRLQTLAIQLVLLILLIYMGWRFSLFNWILAIALAGTMTYQLAKVLPYSSLWKHQSGPPMGNPISILGANVLQDNTNYQAFMDVVHQYNPDVVLVMETNQAWEDALTPLEQDYPHTVKIPLDNYYGMHLYSKRPLKNVEKAFQVEDDVPSIFCVVEGPYQVPIQLIGLHPAPPSPTENDTSSERDAELLLTGKRLQESGIPAVVFGDMNDVVWSRTTRLFKKMTDMMDPRVGRGFYPTYHAQYFFLRFPLDHLFHTPDLVVGKMERTPEFGSDHFAMYYEIHLAKGAPKPDPELEPEEEQEVDEIIEEGKEASKVKEREEE